MTDLISGRLQMMFAAVALALPYVKAGKLKGLAVSSGQRVPAAADYPTIAEAGLPDYEATTWYGVMVPIGTPNHIVTRLHAAFAAALNSADLRAQLNNQGFELVGSTPSQFATRVRTELSKWAKVVKSANIHTD